MTEVNPDLEKRLAQVEQQLALVERHFTSAFWQALDLGYRASLPHRPLRCIVCSHTDLRDGYEVLLSDCIFGGGRLERYRCPKCECVFGPQKYLDLDEPFVVDDYRMLYSRYAEGDSTENEIKTFFSLTPTREGPYLDWGCGGIWSKTLDRLRGQGYDVWGYEPSAETARDHVVNKREMISARFEGIFSNNVIEHLRDPVAQFNDFHTILKDKGVMAHSSPCYEYNYAFTRFHTVFLLGRSPHILAERTGFKVIDHKRDGDYINYVFQRI